MAANLVRVEFPGGVGSRKAPHKLEGHRAEVEGVPYTHVSRNKATDEILPHVLDVDSGAHLVELNIGTIHAFRTISHPPPAVVAGLFGRGGVYGPAGLLAFSATKSAREIGGDDTEIVSAYNTMQHYRCDGRVCVRSSFFPIIGSVVCPTGPHPPLRLARRPNRGHIGGGGWTPSCGTYLNMFFLIMCMHESVQGEAQRRWDERGAEKILRACVGRQF